MICSRGIVRLKKIKPGTCEFVEEKGLACETRISNRELDPGEDIVAYAKEINAGFIVVGIRRRSKVGKLLFGSTAQCVVLNAACPVVTVKKQAK